MLTKFAVRLAIPRGEIRKLFVRNIGASSVVLNKADPIQQIFLDKTREYFKKKSASKGGLVDSSPESVKAVNDELEKISRQYSAKGQNFDEVPKFQFTEPKLDPVDAPQDLNKLI